MNKNSIHQLDQDDKGPFLRWHLNEREEIQMRLCKKCGLAPLFKDKSGIDDGERVTIMTLMCRRCQTAITGTPTTDPLAAIREVVERWNKLQTDPD